MEVSLYDHRNKYHTGTRSSLGMTKTIKMAKNGNLTIGKTDLLYSLKLHFSPEEIEDLYSRLGEILDARNLRKKKSDILNIAQQILKDKANGDT